MTFAEVFGRNLTDARERAGLTQEALHYRSDVHRTSVSKYERGETVPQADAIAKLAGALGIDPGELFRELDWEPGEMTWTSGRFRYLSLGAGGQ